jgi:hypothetical protein
LIALATLGASLLNRQYSKPLTQTVLWTFLPLTALLLASYTKTSLWTPRYIIFVCPYIFFLLALGWIKIWNWQRIIAGGIAVAYALAVGGGLFGYYAIQDREDWRAAIETINQNQLPEDVVAVPSVSSDKVFTATLGHYYDAQSPVDFVGRFRRDDNDEMIQSLQLVSQDANRIWFLMYDPQGNSLNQVSNLLSNHFDVLENREFTGHIYLFLLK